MSACVLDTDVVIAALDRGDAHHRRATRMLQSMIDGETELLARFRALNVSLADGFAMATAKARDAGLASFDRRVRRAVVRARLEIGPEAG